MRVSWLLSLCAFACSAPAETPPPVAEHHQGVEAPEPARAEESPDRPEFPARSVPSPIDEAAPEPTPASPSAVTGRTAALAIEPLEDTVNIVQTVSHGNRDYVLYTRDGAEVARSRIDGEPDGELQLEVIDDAVAGCQGEDDYSIFGCMQSVVPDAYLAAESICEVHGWGVAVLENRDGSVVRLARRSLFALSCDTGSVLDFEPRLSIRDFDGDGNVELQVRLPIAAVRPDGNMTGTTSGVVVYLLDDALRTQFRVTSHYESEVVDTAGTTTTCRAAWHFLRVDADAHDDVRVHATCTETWDDEISGDSRTTRTQEDAVCLWDAPSDTWVCDAEVGTWLFDPTFPGLLGEAASDVQLTLAGALPELLAAARAGAASESETESASESETESGSD